MPTPTHAAPRRLTFAGGFTLTEMAIVLLIVALLLAGIMLPLSAQQEIRARQETERALNDIREALIGYAASHMASDGKPYLPCPDSDNPPDGIENRNDSPPGSCAAQEGALPWVGLGLGRSDAWNNRFRYRVTSGFSNSSTGFALSSSGDMEVCADAACATTIARYLPALVLSHGPNGFGAFNASGAQNAGPTDAAESENANGNSTFVSKTPDGNFDDLVIWVPHSTLTHRMIAAGRLP